jgi:DNA-binding transcriptional MerR regulator
MTNETLYTIGELADAAGVTPRTIRYYTAEGLLPRPDTRGHYALYSQDHLHRLHLIVRLKDAYLPLSEIKARLEQLSADQVRRLLVEYSQPPEPPPASAADYIAQVLATPPSQPAAPRMLAESSPGYAGAEEHRSKGAGEQGKIGTTPIGFATSAPPAASAPAQTGLFKRLVPHWHERDVRPSDAIPPEETWQRVTVAPGVELHIREPLAPDLRARVDRLFERARELLDEDE